MKRRKLVLLITAITALTATAQADVVGWWPFEDNLNDKSGKGRNGLEIGAPTYSTDVPAALGSGKSIRFAGGDADGFTVEEDVSMNSDVFTLGYFVNQDGAEQGNAGFERLTSRAADVFETAIGDAHAVGGTTSSTGSTLSYYQGTWNVTHVEVPATGWIHVAWHNTAEAMELYINGELKYTGAPVPSGHVSGFMNFGIRHNGVEGFEGLMDDAFLWDDSQKPLTPADIAVIAKKGLAAFLALDVDADGDGLPTTWEVSYGLDPQDNGSIKVENGPKGDPDGDSLGNLDEFNLGTSPKDADSDHDGLTDSEEVAMKTNPLKADTDLDGLTDGKERDLKTNPLDIDTDHDGFDDAAEVANGTNPLDKTSYPGGDPSLVLHLTFDGSVNDQSASLNHGTLLGDATYSDDVPEPIKRGQSLKLTNGDGVENQGVKIPANPNLSSNVFTLAYWVKPTTEQGNAGLERLTSRAGDMFETAIGDGNAVGGVTPLQLSYFQGGWRLTDVALTQDKWTHVAWRNKGTGDQDMELFIDGVSAYVGIGVPSGRPGSGFMNIGTRHNTTEGFEGFIDELYLYTRELSGDEIKALAAPKAEGFRVLRLSRGATSGELSIVWESVDGQRFRVEQSLTLLPGSWTTVKDSIQAAANPAKETSSTINVNPNEPAAYFRVALISP